MLDVCVDCTFTGLTYRPVVFAVYGCIKLHVAVSCTKVCVVHCVSYRSGLVFAVYLYCTFMFVMLCYTVLR